MNRLEAIDELLTYFKYDHLPKHLQPFSKPLHDLAYSMVDQLAPHNLLQLEEGLKKLLEAKDCFVRASIKKPKPADVAALED